MMDRATKVRAGNPVDAVEARVEWISFNTGRSVQTSRGKAIRSLLHVQPGQFSSGLLCPI